MTKKPILLASLTAFICGVPTYATVTITFDDYPAPALLSDFYRPQGVLFSTVDYDSMNATYSLIAPHVRNNDDPGASPSPPNSITPVTSQANWDPSQFAVLLDFVQPGTNTPALSNMVAVQLDNITSGAPNDDICLWALGQDGAILGMDCAGDKIFPVPVLEIQTGTFSIAKAVIEFIPIPGGSPDHENYDNVQFNIPEPATLCLIAIAGMTLVNRRRTRA